MLKSNQGVRSMSFDVNKAQEELSKDRKETLKEVINLIDGMNLTKEQRDILVKRQTLILMYNQLRGKRDYNKYEKKNPKVAAEYQIRMNELSVIYHNSDDKVKDTEPELNRKIDALIEQKKQNKEKKQNK